MVIDPEMVHGQLTFKGARVPVSTVMAYLAKGLSLDEIVQDWPQCQYPGKSLAARRSGDGQRIGQVTDTGGPSRPSKGVIKAS
ncbi:MAG: DUF433 domain-containing protein [Chloroflexi bacterium]|nr:DUF433 domain-containing protein [Chloroflexota bacterium]